eukprot:maker-scaffold3528_size8314-snap-gene-0.6 protein:Tk02961 transcript:maker-scaffold3528_size8314-snap-gene-0.6-mRNA-1 annotation:"hypothetical protein"
MWKGRFSKATADLVQQYGESISYDWRLYPHDIAGSIAHARAQVKAGILTDEEFSQIEAGLREIEKEIAAGDFEFSIEREDIHMNIEAVLTEKIGPVGGKLHTARSRNDQDLILWCSSEFGFATLSDAHTTGSSLMPQKKNPDVCELTRGKTGRLYGNLTAILTAIKGLPLTYNRDLQEDKEPLFDSIDTLTIALKVNTEMIAEMEINEEACQAAASDPLLLATDLADWLVKQGIPFRSAHELVGKAVAASVTTGTPLDQLDLTTVDPAFTAEASAVFDLKTALAARTNPGSPSVENVRAQGLAGRGFLNRHHFGRRALRDEVSAFLSARGTEVDEVIADRNDIEIVLHHDQRVAGIAQTHEDFEQNLHVLIMKPGRRFIEQIEGVARCRFREFTGQFHALRLAA